ncbi:MAG: AAA family ATPase [Novosphingobium meiothermophilum]
MLRKLDISRFKTIKGEKLEFGRVNLFIGGNGAGKSNILEAIGLASACFDRGLGDSDLGRKGMRLTPPELMKSSFKGDELPKTLELKAAFDRNVTYRCQLQSSERDPLLRVFSEKALVDKDVIFGRSHRGARATGVSHADRLDKSRGIWDQIKATYDQIPDEVGEIFSEFGRYVIYSPQTDFLRGRQSGRVDVPPIGLHGEGLTAAVDTILRHWRREREKQPGSAGSRLIDSCLDLAFLPGWASMFGTSTRKKGLTSRDLAQQSARTVYFLDKFMREDRNRLSAYDSSEGTLFLLFTAIILAAPDAPKIFALDNVDNALNPSLTRRLVEQIIKVTNREWGDSGQYGARQVFLTSHNPTALDAFDLFDDEQRVFVVFRNPKGHTKVNRLVPPSGSTREQWNVAKGGRNLSELWLDGEIPNALGSL